MIADAVVVGGGVAGLNAAYQLAKNGLKPMLIESRSRCGGLVAGAPLAGTWIDIGADSYARRSKYCHDLCHELGLQTREPGGASWVWDANDRVFPLPYGVLGIPADLDDPQVVAALGGAALDRACQDLSMGPEPGADALDLASLVRTRLGEDAYQILVRPVAGGIYSTEPETLSTDVVIPGLRAAMAQTGSLVRAAARLRAAAPDGPVVSAVVGGMFRMVEAMTAQIDASGQVKTRTMLTRLEPPATSDSVWRVHCAATKPGPTPADPPVADGEPWVVETRRVVVAADGDTSMDILRDLPDLEMGDWTLPLGAKVAHVVLALTNPGLDVAPRGSGMLVAPRHAGNLQIGAKAVTHLNVKWPWLGSDTHYLRVSYGRPGEDPQPSLEDGLKDAAILLGVPLSEDDVVASMIVHWGRSLPPPTPEHRNRVAKLCHRIERLPGLGVTGAWVAGNGLASVLPHAQREAERLL